MYDIGTDFDFNIFSLSSGKNIPVFYADLAGINSQININKRSLAIEFLNIIIGKDVLIKAAAPQYLLTARKSVYELLSKSNPVYERLKNIVTTPDNRIFTLRPNAGEYLNNIKSILRLKP